MAVTLLILDRLSKLYHCQILQQICSKAFITVKHTTAPHMRRYTTLFPPHIWRLCNPHIFSKNAA